MTIQTTKVIKKSKNKTQKSPHQSSTVTNSSQDTTNISLITLMLKSFDEDGKVKSYIGVRQIIIELMAMSGIKQACKEDEAGKELSNLALAEYVRQLKFGDYQITDNV